MRVTVDDLLRGCRAFREHESRDAMYRVSCALIEQRWGDAAATADALGVLLLTWNQAAYRYGRFDFDRLEDFLAARWDELDYFRATPLEDIPELDEPRIRRLFVDLLDSLITVERTRSPVGAGKALHLLAPSMFPLWDNKIARNYGCRLYGAPGSDRKYARFMTEIRNVLQSLSEEKPLDDLVGQLNAAASFPKPILKYIDEYNYAKFTYAWID